MARWNYYSTKLTPINNLEEKVRSLDTENPDIELVLDIYRAVTNGMKYSGYDGELFLSYKAIKDQLGIDISEYVSTERAKIKDTYEMQDYRDVPAFDEWANFVSQLPEDLYEDPEGAIEELRNLIHIDTDQRVDYDEEGWWE